VYIIQKQDVAGTHGGDRAKQNSHT
jgi:hypothetical protein